MIQMEHHEDNVANGAVSSDDEDPLEEEEAKLRSIHFLKRGDSDVQDGEKIDVSSRRYDEMGSFLSRSERSITLPDEPPTPEELAERRVQIKEEVDDVHNVDPMSQEEAENYYMTEADFRRVDIEVELTQMRYEKAKKNKAKFDESENPTRGLEEFLDTKRRRATLRKKHREAVLQEMVRQKTGGSKKLDWEKIRSAAEPYSKETAQIAYEIAMEDAGKPVSKSKSSSKSSGGKTKKKGGLFGIFKKK